MMPIVMLGDDTMQKPEELSADVFFGGMDKVPGTDHAWSEEIQWIFGSWHLIRLGTLFGFVIPLGDLRLQLRHDDPPGSGDPG